jgi:hypothetical protein
VALDPTTGYILACLDDHVKSSQSLRLLQQHKAVKERERELITQATSWGVIMTEQEAREIVAEYDQFMAAEPGTVRAPLLC